jgi:adenylosuccinate lyase
VGREQAHEAIGEHAVAVAGALREGAATNDLAVRLAADDRLRLDRGTIDGILADRASFAGAADRQVEAFCRQVEDVVTQHPEAAGYRPEPIL